MTRIVSLLASATELVVELGLGDRLVGRSHECDQPAWVKSLPVLSKPTFDITGSSTEIDARVRAKLAAGQPLYEIDEPALAALAPDFVLTQTHCEVCAVSPANLEGGTCRLERRQVVALNSGGGTVAGVLDGFARVAEVLGAREAGRALVAGLRERLARVAAATAPLPRPRVACLEWIDPLFAMGNWGPEIVEAAGGTCVLGVAGAHSAALPFDALAAADPDVVVIAPCGFDLTRTLDELPALTRRQEWKGLRAVRNGRAYAADGNLYFNRSSPTLFDTPALLAEMLHPDHFPPRRRGAAWVPIPG
ncbi:MAG TPA: ABC transporter substrate-binding protein [Polyangia bacterium]|nr:ABC transporter substrate-binding protein [Polyangia bacterium]